MLLLCRCGQTCNGLTGKQVEIASDFTRVTELSDMGAAMCNLPDGLQTGGPGGKTSVMQRLHMCCTVFTNDHGTCATS